MKRFWIFILCFVVLLPISGRAQISQGGEPLKIANLKSSRNRIIEMPAIKNLLVLENNSETKESDNLLKPFQFAYPFEVDLSPENSGEWFQSNNGFYVWKLTVRSSEAKSLNLIFEDFEIPEKARLFVFSETEDHVLGAFTKLNNKSSGKFAISPVAGDEITVQYEVPEEYQQNKPFRIATVNHDYIGILKSGIRRPLGKAAGTCNIDVNCDEWDTWNEVKNSVCRMIVNGNDVCSGVLVNNTAENQKPYILSAAHCYAKWIYAETTVYTFNYESPFCKPLDGDPSNSISGAKMKAQFDTLDFALVELSLVPPPNFRPYYAGWNSTTDIPASTAGIHHPQGDIKKLSIDNNSPVITNYGEPIIIDKDYLKNGFLRINKWEGGTTENGSSGSPLFDTDKNIIGTLTGGYADCKNSVNDYYERFSNAWDYKSDSTKQLKYWLDPLKSGLKVLSGKQFNEGENLCGAFTNLTNADKYEVVPLLISNKFSGYWGGSNNSGITEFMERFSIEGNETLSGISFGVGSLKNVLKSSLSEIMIKVYSGNLFPEKLVYSQTVKISSFVANAMNFVGFQETVEPNGDFFVGFELSNIQALDTFVVYQSLRTSTDKNSFYFKQSGQWYDFKESNPEKKSMANVFELVACNIDDFSTDTPLVDDPLDVLIFPNPTNSKVFFEAGQDIPDNSIAIFNILGQKSEIKITRISERKVEINLMGNVPGVYFVRFDNGKEIIARKISFVPW